MGRANNQRINIKLRKRWRGLRREPYEKVHHPKHYGGDTTYECIKVIEAWGLDKDFCLGTVLRYISRMGKKPGETSLDDLRKSAWYLNRKIEQLEKGSYK